MDESTSKKLTKAIAKWVATDCRPVLGTLSGWRVVTRRTPHRRELHETEKEAKMDGVALTGDHWTSVSNQNKLYLK